MREAFAKVLYQLARSNPKIFIVVADISPAASMAPFQEEFPNYSLASIGNHWRNFYLEFAYGHLFL